MNEPPDPKTKKSKAGKQENLFSVLPNWIDREAWNGWSHMRMKKKAPLTEGAAKRAIENLARLYQENGCNAEYVKLVLNQSEDRNWLGLFAVGDGYLEERGLKVRGEPYAVAQRSVKQSAGERHASGLNSFLARLEREEAAEKGAAGAVGEDLGSVVSTQVSH